MLLSMGRTSGFANNLSDTVTKLIPALQGNFIVGGGPRRLRRISYLGVYWRKSHHPVLEGYVAQQFRVVFLHQFRLSRTPNRSRFEEPARRECIKKSVLKKKAALTSPAGVRKRRANETGF
jgi:hypothetical protein